MYKCAIEKITCQARLNGSRVTDLGARLFGKAPHIAPEAWLHCLFQGLLRRDVEGLEERIGRRFHPDFSSLLESFNGASFFSGHLSILGDRVVNDRFGDAAWQPFDIVVTNTIERARGTPDSWIYVGSYFWDGSNLAIDSVSGEVVRLPRRQPDKTLNTWPSLDAMLSSEILRLTKLFDAQGRQISPDAPTTPD